MMFTAALKCQNSPHAISTRIKYMDRVYSRKSYKRRKTSEKHYMVSIISIIRLFTRQKFEKTIHVILSNPEVPNSTYAFCSSYIFCRWVGSKSTKQFTTFIIPTADIHYNCNCAKQG